MIGDGYYNHSDCKISDLKKSIIYYEIAYRLRGTDKLLLKLSNSIYFADDFSRMNTYYIKFNENKIEGLTIYDKFKYQGAYITSFYYEYGFNRFAALFENSMIRNEHALILINALMPLIRNAQTKPNEDEWIVNKCSELKNRENIDLLSKCYCLHIMIEIYEKQGNTEKADFFEAERQDLLKIIEKEGLSPPTDD